MKKQGFMKRKFSDLKQYFKNVPNVFTQHRPLLASILQKIKDYKLDEQEFIYCNY